MSSTYTRADFGAYLASENDAPAATGRQIADSVADFAGITASASEDVWLDAFGTWQAAGGWDRIPAWDELSAAGTR